MVTSPNTPILRIENDPDAGSSRSDYITFKKNESGEQPQDRFHVAYIIFYFLGITTLLPWNFFITANDYWMYKFRDTKTQLNSTFAPLSRTPLQASFTSYLSLACNLPNIICLLINIAILERVRLQVRMIGSLVLMLIFFILTTIFVNINTDSWEMGFFAFTLTTVVLLNVSGAILNGSLFGLVGKFSSKYITAVISGQALGGIFTSLAQIASLSIGASSIHSAFFYFLIGDSMILFSLISYIILSGTSFFTHHHVEDRSVETIQTLSFARYKAICRKISPYGISVMLVFLVTLTVFPSVTVLIESEGKGRGHRWNDVYFVPVVGYLVFNVWDYIGRLLSGTLKWPRKSWILILLSVMRLVFIPLLIFCNAQPRNHLPVFINKDVYYIIIMSLFGVSNGFLANLSLICAPKVVEEDEKEAASSMMAVFLGLGLMIGSATSVLIVKIL